MRRRQKTNGPSWRLVSDFQFLKSQISNPCHSDPAAFKTQCKRITKPAAAKSKCHPSITVEDAAAFFYPPSFQYPDDRQGWDRSAGESLRSTWGKASIEVVSSTPRFGYHGRSRHRLSLLPKEPHERRSPASQHPSVFGLDGSILPHLFECLGGLSDCPVLGCAGSEPFRDWSR